MMTDLPNVALSIRQPWAWLIVAGHKDVENRSWATRFRGWVLIHAGIKVEVEALCDLVDGTCPADGSFMAADFKAPEAMETGGIVGVAEIYDCVTASPSRWFVGEHGFLIRNAQPLPFRPCRGQLGFFKPDYSPIPPKGERQALRRVKKTPDMFDGVEP